MELERSFALPSTAEKLMVVSLAESASGVTGDVAKFVQGPD